MNNTNHKAKDCIVRRAAAIRLLAKCSSIGIRVWMRHGIVRFCMIDDEQTVPEPWASKLQEHKDEIADIIGHHKQRHLYATEIVDGCRVYWLPQTMNVDEDRKTDAGPNAA